MTLTQPAFTLNWAATSKPNASSPSYVDLASRLLKFDTSRGKLFELDAVGPGTMNLELDNRDGALNQWNTASQFYGNLLTANQASLETDTTGWAGQAGVTISRDTGLFDDGVASLQMQLPASTGDVAARTTEGTGGVPVSHGLPYWAMASFAAPVTARNCDVSIVWYDSGGTLITTVTGATVFDSGWTQATVTGTAPLNARFAAVQVRAHSAALGENHNVDKISFNGGNPFTSPFGFTWQPGGVHGNAKPMRKMQLKGADPGSSWTSAGPFYIFTGFVESWRQSWRGEADVRTLVTVVDGFTLLNRKKIATTAFHDAQMADSPAGLYRFDENGQVVVSGLVTAADSSGNGRDAFYKGSPSDYGSTGALAAETSTAIDLGIRQGWVELPITTCPSGTGDWSIEALVFPRSISQSIPVDYIWQVLPLGTQSAGLAILADGTLNFSAMAGAPGLGGNLESTTALNLNQWNHVVAVKSGTAGPSGWKLYLNGVDVSGTATVAGGGGNVSMTSNDALIGGFTSGGVDQPAFDGLVDEFAIYYSALSGARVTAHYAATYGLLGDSLAGARIGNLLDLIGWPAGDRDLDTGQFQLAPMTAPLFKETVLSVLQNIVDSEGYPANLFVSGDGKVTFQDRAHSTPSSSGTWGDGSSDWHYVLDGSGPELAVTQVRNEIIRQSTTGAVQRAVDATSQDRYGDLTDSKTGLYNAADSDLATVCSDLLARYKDAHDRLPPIRVTPWSDPNNLFPAVLGAEFNNRYTARRLNLYQGGGDPFTMDARLEHIAHRWDAETGWESELAFIPT